MEADLVVLATAIEPSKDARKLATMLTASMDTNDFFTEAHAKLRPVESPTASPAYARDRKISRRPLHRQELLLSK